jgi:hypothetical protein
MPPDAGELVREIDPRGHVVRLTADQWHSHILPRHPDVAGYLAQIPGVIRNPDTIRRDALQWHRECYYRQHVRPSGRLSYLKVIVDLLPGEDAPGFVVTCHLTTRFKPGEEVLWSPSI